MHRHPEWPSGAELLYSAEEVGRAFDRIAGALKPRLAGREPVVLAVMNGGMYPTVALTRRLDFPLRLDYVHATRYRGGTTGGEIQWVHWPGQSFAGSVVLLVDDIFDEGHTLTAIHERLAAETEAEVITAVLALKRHDRGLARDWVDYFGLEVPDRYVFGSGMDYHGRWRQADGIWALPDQS